MSSRPSPLETEPSGETEAREAELVRADTLRRLGRGREALTALRDLIAREGADHASYILHAELLSRFGEHEAAVDGWSAAIATAPTRLPDVRLSQLLVARAEDQLRHGRAADAREAMLALARRRPPAVAEMSILRRAIQSPADLERFAALLAPLTTQPGTPARASLTQLSLAYRDAGEDELAIATARQRLLVGLAQTPFGSLARRGSATWRQDAAVAFGDLVDDLQLAGAAPFLVSGTLLGHIRDGGIIAHDKDLDLGVLNGPPADRLADGLSRSGRFRLRPASTDTLLQVEHANGVVADVFLHWEEGGRILHGGRRGTWWNSPFALAETKMLGRHLLMPADVETYLRENYGPGWRTPHPEFETFLDTPNLLPPPASEMRWYYLTKLHDLHGAGRAAVMARVWAALQASGGADPQLREAVDAALAAASAQ